MKEFWAKVDKTKGCWYWQGGTNGRYGMYCGQLAHRISYTLMIGEIPEGLEIDHLCRNTICVRPSHLEPVTHSENILRGHSFNRSKDRCPKGHRYTSENTTINKGKRYCRTCKREDCKRRKAVKRK